MDLADMIQRGQRQQPPRIIIYGPGGVGKTTWAAGAPGAVILPTEDGSDSLDVARLPKATSYHDVMQSLNALHDQPHEFRTLVVDSLDHMEPLIWRATCEIGGKRSIEDFGYGRGYVEALGIWRQFFALCDDLRSDRGMALIYVAHHEIKSYQDPSSEPYDRYQIKMHKTAAALAIESVDAVLFATYRVHAVEGSTGRVRGMGSGERILLTEERPSHIAKNRWNLPYELPLDFAVFAAAKKSASKNTTTAENTASKE
jgi:hypothetical protein